MFRSRRLVFALCVLAIGAIASTRSLLRPDVSSADPSLSQAGGRVLHRGALFTGRLETKDAGGVLHERANYHDGLLDGEQARWHADGRLAEARTWRDGAKVGTHRGWWPNGVLQFTCTYANGLSEVVRRRQGSGHDHQRSEGARRGRVSHCRCFRGVGARAVKDNSARPRSAAA